MADRIDWPNQLYAALVIVFWIIFAYVVLFLSAAFVR